MNALRHDLSLDALHTAVRQRRRKRLVRSSSLVLVPLLLFAKGALFFSAPASPSEALLEAASPPSPLYQPISSDEELLSLLADQGPVLVSHPDGTQTLILTNPPSPLAPVGSEL